jgi:hypothetical protein
MLKTMIFLILLALGCRELRAEAIPGQELLNYFSSSCKTQGKWSKIALSEAQALMKSIESVLNDEDCKTIAGAISQLNTLSAQIVRLDNLGSDHMELAGLSAKEQELLLYVGRNASDVNLSEQINSTLLDIQLEQAQVMGRIDAHNYYAQPQLADLLAQIVLTTNAAFNQVVANQRCMIKKPGILSGAAALVASVGATAAISNPALGLGLAATGDFIGTIVEAIRKKRLTTTIRQVADGTTALEAFNCVLESLSSRWCEMAEVEKYINFKAKYQNVPIQAGELGSAIRLYDREIPAFLHWLNKIRAGIPSSSSADASRQKRVFEREASVRSSKAMSNGIIAENRPLFDGAQDPKEKWTFLRSTVLKLGQNIGIINPYTGNRSGDDPMYEIYNTDYAPYYLLGLDRIPKTSSGSNIDFNSFDPFSEWPAEAGPFVPNFETMTKKFDEWVELARARVDQELNLVLNPDASSAISSAFDGTDNRWKLPAIDALKSIIKFLQLHGPQKRFSNPAAFKNLYADTITKLKTIQEAIEKATLGPTPIDPLKALEVIYKNANLQFGIVILQNRLGLAVRLAIYTLISSTDPETQAIAAQFLAADRFEDVLSQISGTDNLALIAADIKKAQPITLNTLQGFVDVFGKSIRETLSYIMDQEKRSPKDLAPNYERSRAELCYGLLAAPVWPKSVAPSYCLGLKLDPVIPGGPVTDTITYKMIFEGSYQNRACQFQDYLSRSKIFQDWNILVK